MKIITICGSMRFKNTMLEVYKELTNLGYIVLLPAFDCYKHNHEWYSGLHFEKINISDAIFVVDEEGYIGTHTQQEIDKAKERNIKIFYYSNDYKDDVRFWNEWYFL